MTGYEREKVPIVINACDVVLLTSTHEGWPNIIKEGLACNVPFVSTDVSDLNDIAVLSDNCVVTSSNYHDLSIALESVLDMSISLDLRKFVSHMDMDLVTQKIGGIYNKMLE